MRSANRNGTGASRQRIALRRRHGARAGHGSAGRRTRHSRTQRRQAAIALLVLGAVTAPAFGRNAPPAFEACTDFHCDMTVPVSLSGTQWQQVLELFRSASTPAKAGIPASFPASLRACDAFLHVQ